MSCFFPAKRGTLGVGVSPGIENPTTEEVGSAFPTLLGVEGDPSERNNDAHDFFTGGTKGAVAGACVKMLIEFSCKTPASTLGEGIVTALRSVTEADTEMFEEVGEPGVSGTVEHAGVVSVAKEDGIFMFVGDAVEVFFSEITEALVSRSDFLIEGIGVMGGVGRSRASSTTF